MKRSSRDYLAYLCVADLVSVNVALLFAEQLRFTLDIGTEITPEAGAVSPVVYLLATVTWFLVFSGGGVYSRARTQRLNDELAVVTLAALVATVGFAGLLYLSFRGVSRMLFLYFFLLILLFCITHRLAFRMTALLPGWRGRHDSRVLLVGQFGGVAEELLRSLSHQQRWSGLKAVGCLTSTPDHLDGLPRLGGYDDLAQVVERSRIDEVIFSFPADGRAQLTVLVGVCHRLPVNVRLVPDFHELALHRARLEAFAGVPLVSLRDPAIDGFPRLTKRLFDLAASSVLLVMLAPLFAILLLAIRLDSSGPLVFRQRRVGENGHLFWMFKFRSMEEGADDRLREVAGRDEQGHLLHKRRDDPRVTRMGRWLRRTSLDELPQLFNVMRGDMSLVGPRPELPLLVDMYEPWQRKRFAVPQGMTGWWQINGRSDRPLHLSTEDDLYYIENHSFLLDLEILIKTVGVVLRGRGAF